MLRFTFFILGPGGSLWLDQVRGIVLIYLVFITKLIKIMCFELFAWLYVLYSKELRETRRESPIPSSVYRENGSFQPNFVKRRGLSHWQYMGKRWFYKSDFLWLKLFLTSKTDLISIVNINQHYFSKKFSILEH